MENNVNIVNEENINTNNATVGEKKGFELDFKNLKNLKIDKKLLIGIGIGVVALVLLLVILMRDGSKVVADKFAKGMLEGDSKVYLDICHEDFIDTIEKWQDEDFEDYLDEFFEEEFDDYEIKSYEITKVKDADEDDLEDTAELLEEMYDIDEKSVKAMKTYTIKFVVEYDGEEEKEKIKLPVIKVDGKWYVFNVPDDFV